MIDHVRVSEITSDDGVTIASIDIGDLGALRFRTYRKENNFLATEIRQIGEALIRAADLHQTVMQRFLDYKQSVYAAETDFLDRVQALHEDTK